MTARRLVIWRHGRTQWNNEGRFQGQSDIPLDSEGVAQAAASAPLLASYAPAALVSSDLSRTRQTASALSELTGLPVQEDPDLREIDVGSWAGRSIDEVKAELPDLYGLVSAGDVEVRRGQTGETLREVADRVEKGLRRALDLVPDGSTVVVAGHGLATRVGAGQFLGLAPSQWNLLGKLANCAWVVLRYGRTGWQLGAWNLQAG